MKVLGVVLCRQTLAGICIKSPIKGDTMFKKQNYLPFMLRVFIIGGFITLPLTYLESLPWYSDDCIIESEA